MWLNRHFLVSLTTCFCSCFLSSFLHPKGASDQLTCARLAPVSLRFSSSYTSYFPSSGPSPAAGFPPRSTTNHHNILYKPPMPERRQ
ncbi:hypothetical protein BDZ94DRAFT_1257493 [Collybia nuda]|uniref:Secreted protein n=1 Tax=Collybia nuda TaxID=64659 RepID=A0A9P6CFG0_9AGAR|nr:hypothetical protein BDZ94DRAFT_1257493 [Collybia nuda]